jgi:hypothetical protein
MTTPLLQMPEYVSGQLQPEIPINTTARILEQGCTRFVVLEDDLTAPPGGEMDGDAYRVAGGATGAWEGKSDHIALFIGTAWWFVAPREGLRYEKPGGFQYVYRGTDSPAQGWTLESATAASIQHIAIACSDETTNLTAGTAKVTFRLPYAFTLSEVRASLTVPQPGGAIFTVDINVGGSSILSTKLTIDNTETTSVTAATPAVISSAALGDNAEATIDIDQVGDAGAKGLKVYLIGVRTS